MNVGLLILLRDIFAIKHGLDGENPLKLIVLEATVRGTDSQNSCYLQSLSSSRYREACEFISVIGRSIVYYSAHIICSQEDDYARCDRLGVVAVSLDTEEVANDAEEVANDAQDTGKASIYRHNGRINKLKMLLKD